ncbi:MAG: peptidoglycan editing factor PgeF [Pseudomonadota bacterium]|jgi:YfiH family protein
MSRVERIEGFPAGISAVLTLRGQAGEGASAGSFASFNLATHVGDDPAAVGKNRAIITEALSAQPVWLTQVHGTQVVTIDHRHPPLQRPTQPAQAAQAFGPGKKNIILDPNRAPEADASLTRRSHLACAILVADCLPVLAAREDGGLVGAAHAGWRGLSNGVVLRLLDAMRENDPGAAALGLRVWLGPCIGPSAFEVGPEVEAAFVQSPAFLGVEATAFFRPSRGKGDRRLADLSGLARAQCLAWSNRTGIPLTGIMQDGRCTVTEPDRFYSYRRDGQTGRFAALIWRNPEDSGRESI